MSKPKSNSALDALPEDQRQQLESWLFDENIAYGEAVKRLSEKFSVSTSTTSLSGWYQRARFKRMLTSIVQSRTNANEVVKQLKANPADVYQALLGLVGQAAFEAGMEGKNYDPKLLADFTKLVMDARKQDLTEQHLALDREKFEFDATKAALKQLPKLKKIQGDDKLSDRAKLTAARRLLFGILPEEQSA